jgi:aminoglycoside/choline kinase family phosphotransferase
MQTTSTPEQAILQASSASVAYLGDDFQVFRLAGDASNREYFRVLHHNRDSCVWMLLPESGQESLAQEYENTSHVPSDLPFLTVAQHLQAKNVRIPEVLVADVPHRTLLLEDLGDTMLIDPLAHQPKKYLSKALDLLAQISAPDGPELQQGLVYQRKFDQDLYNWEFEHFLEYGIMNFMEFDPEEVQTIRQNLHKLTQEYVTWASVFCHRDFHSRNILVEDAQTLAVIDFQDALLAPLYYDLASLLKDAYVEIDRPMQKELVAYYQSVIDDSYAEKKLPAEEFLYRFDIMSLHRNLKAAGRFVYFDQVNNNPDYLKYIPQCMKYVVETLQAYPKLSPLRHALEPYAEKLIVEV